MRFTEEERARLGNDIFGSVDHFMYRSRSLSTGMPESGSSLDADDQMIFPYSVSDGVNFGIHTAVEHLHALRLLVVDIDNVHVTVPFTLVRASIETAAMSLWLLKGATRKERVLRRLRQLMKEEKDQENWHLQMGSRPSRTFRDVKDELTSIARRVTGDSSFKLVPPTSTAVVKSASPCLGSIDAFLTWQICSAFAHGGSWASKTILNRIEKIGTESRGGYVRAVITNDIDRVLWGSFTAHLLVREVLPMCESRSVNHLAALTGNGMTNNYLGMLSEVPMRTVGSIKGHAPSEHVDPARFNEVATVTLATLYRIRKVFGALTARTEWSNNAVLADACPLRARTPRNRNSAASGQAMRTDQLPDLDGK